MNIKSLVLAVLIALAPLTALRAQEVNGSVSNETGVQTTNESSNVNLNDNNSNGLGIGGNNGILLEDNKDSNIFNFQQPAPMTFNEIQQLIQTRYGTLHCPVNARGTEIRLSFPPAIVFKNQKVESEDCMEAFATLGAGAQADVLSNMIAFFQKQKGLGLYSDAEIEVMLFQLKQQLAQLFVADMYLDDAQAREMRVQGLLEQIGSPTSNTNIVENYETVVEQKLETGATVTPPAPAMPTVEERKAQKFEEFKQIDMSEIYVGQPSN